MVGIIVAKEWIMSSIDPAELTLKYEQWEMLLKTFGFKFKQADPSSPFISFKLWKSVEFEVYSTVICFLLSYLYHDLTKKHQLGKPIEWIHHSDYLSKYMTIYHMFFLMLTIDTFFAQTIIQMVVLGKSLNGFDLIIIQH